VQWMEDVYTVATQLRGRVLAVHAQTWQHCLARIAALRRRLHVGDRRHARNPHRGRTGCIADSGFPEADRIGATAAWTLARVHAVSTPTPPQILPPPPRRSRRSCRYGVTVTFTTEKSLK
jgi:hypothetical protein